jgi:hypothetical protein
MDTKAGLGRWGLFSSLIFSHGPVSDLKTVSATGILSSREILKLD